MQTEFDLHYPSLQVEILGMNQLGHEIGNPSITDGRDIPWLQDVDSDDDGRSDVWLNSWDFEYRDVVLVDDDGGSQGVFNLTQRDLSHSSNYQALKDRFIEVAAPEPLTRWQSPIEPLDVDANSIIGPLDALLVINELGNYPPDGVLPTTGEVHNYIDTDGDGVVAPLDALLVINQLDVIAEHMARESAPMAPLSSSSSVALPVDAVGTDSEGSDDSEPREIADSSSMYLAATTELQDDVSPFGRADFRSSVAQVRSLAVDDTADAEAARIDILLADPSWGVV